MYGAIDIGTNAARLLIGEVISDGNQSFMRKVSYTRIPLRLGYDVFENNRISESKTADFIKTMHAFKLLADVYKVRELRACATSAMREAENGLDLKKQILEQTGLNIEIIDGEEEAQLIFDVFKLLNIKKDLAYIVIDVGGGSCEITLFDNGLKVAEHSFQVGTIRLLKEKASAEIWQEIEAWIKEKINPRYTYRIFGTGGNINKCHKMLGKQVNEAISYRELNDLYGELKHMPMNKRIFRYQLKEDRADVIVPALKIYRHIMKAMKAKEIHVPKIGLSDGIIYGLYQKELSAL